MLSGKGAGKGRRHSSDYVEMNSEKLLRKDFGLDRQRARLLSSWLLPLALACLTSGAALVSHSDSSEVYVLEVKGYIGPPVADYVQRGVRAAESKGAECLVVLLDTPGGLDTAMRGIVEALLGAKMPTVVYVSPKGARAASAGVFIASAANVLAMAPGTSIGAAHPVALEGELTETMEEKVTSDAAAYIRSIAEARGRNVEWLQDAVRKSVSASANEAVDLGVADLVADDVASLLTMLDGKSFTIDSTVVTLETGAASLRRMDMNFVERFLHVLADPNIAYVLLSIGTLGIMIELLHFGLIAPGVIGVVCLVLAFLSFGSLPLNWAGLALVGMAFLLFVVALIMPGFGVPEVGGIICFILGSFFLFGEAGPTLPEVRVSRWLIGAMGALMSALAGYAVYTITMSRRGVPAMASTTIVGQVGVARSRLNPSGTVQLASELWSAISDREEVIEDGEEVEVTAVEGLRLRVRKAAQKRR